MKKEELREKLYLKNCDEIKGFKRVHSNEKLKIIGITGSHGKSTIAYLLNEYLKLLGYRTVLYSSIMVDSLKSSYIQQKSLEIPLESEVVLYNALTEAMEYNADYLILEVNDSTIYKGFINELDMDVKVLTNIYEKENQMYDDYVEIKKRFMREGNHKSVIGLISDHTINLFNELKGKEIITYSTEFFIENKKLDIRDVNYFLKPFKDQYNSFSGLVFEVMGLDKKLKLKTNLNMPFHGINILCLLAVIDTLKLFDKNTFSKFVSNICIPGRDEIIKYKNGFIMISNTFVPHLEVLQSYKGKEVDKITLITGASGNEFPTWNKTYLSERFIKQREYDMNYAYKYAKQYADNIIITSNDSGNSDIKNLLNTQEKHVKDFKNYLIFEERREAIKHALENISPKEVIFISGRGNREIMCKDNKIFKHLDKDVVVKIIGGIDYE